MKKYKVNWDESCSVEIEADTENEAIEKVKNGEFEGSLVVSEETYLDTMNAQEIK